MNAARSFGKFCTILGLAVIAVLPVGCASSTGKTSFTRIEIEVKAFISHYITTLERGEREDIRSLFIADDRFAWYTDGAQSYASADDVLAGMDRFAGIRFRTDISRIHVVPITASLASVRSNFVTTLTIPGKDNYEYSGVITWLVEKVQTSGKWRVHLGHTSTPGGPPSRDDKQG